MKKPTPFSIARSASKTTTINTNANVFPPPSHPMKVARELVKRLFTLSTSQHLSQHRGDFYAWSGAQWTELETRDLKSRCYALLEHAVYDDVDSKTGLVTQKPF